jgi:hypothetical protein
VAQGDPMDFPKSVSELGIWLAMQFPVLAAAVLLARWAVQHTERLHENRSADARRLYEGLLAEKDSRLRDRDERILQLMSEVGGTASEAVQIQKTDRRAKTD